MPAEVRRALLDTQALLWMLNDSKRLSNDARAIVRDPAVGLVVSAASLWEIAIKRSIGKLKAPTNLARRLLATGQFELLSISPVHAEAVGDLPWHHRDPFDRLLVAQALVEGLMLVSSDTLLVDYGVPVAW